MKLVETFKNDQTARERRDLLSDAGISAKIVVDPLESLYPALATFRDVAIFVAEENVSQAAGILNGAAVRQKAS